MRNFEELLKEKNIYIEEYKKEIDKLDLRIDKLLNEIDILNDTLHELRKQNEILNYNVDYLEKELIKSRIVNKSYKKKILMYSQGYLNDILKEVDNIINEGEL